MINDNITNEEKAKLTANALVDLSEGFHKLQEHFLKSHKALNRDIQLLKTGLQLVNWAFILLAGLIILMCIGLLMGSA